MTISPLSDWLPTQNFPAVIAGPCSAETPDQVMEVATALAADKRVVAMRAGVWKPRTEPGNFEGVGAPALPWLQAAKAATGLKIAIEVAKPEHIELALKHDIDILWLGARTVVNPFVVAELAQALRGTNVPIMVKNPSAPDLKLWTGSINRLVNVGITKIAAIHRGFSTYEKIAFRNDPIWTIPIDFRRAMPEVPLINDPSHITGKRDLVAGIAQKAMDLAFDGLMIETHPTPETAWSDAAQQITPAALTALLNSLNIPYGVNGIAANNHTSEPDLELRRGELDVLDSRIIELLARRMKVVKEIGELKKQENLAVLQIKRWDQVINNLMKEGRSLGLSEEVVKRLYDLIHDASIQVQEEVFRGK